MGFWVVGLWAVECSAEIDSTLRPRREEISRLAAGHTMLKKFQFLFELPSRLRQCIEMGAVSQVGHQYLCPHNEPPSPPSFFFFQKEEGREVGLALKRGCLTVWSCSRFAQRHPNPPTRAPTHRTLRCANTGCCIL